MSREALVLLVCCCDFRDGAERLISSKSLRNAVIRAFPGLFRILRMCVPRRAAAVVRPRGREKSADRRRRILISRLLIIRASVPRRKSPFPAYFKGFPAVSPLIPPYPAFLKYPVSPHTGFQILPTSKKDIDRSFRRELLYKLPPFNFQFEPRWMFLFNLRHLLTTLLELLARSCAAACPRRHRECGAPHGGGDLTR